MTDSSIWPLCDCPVALRLLSRGLRRRSIRERMTGSGTAFPDQDGFERLRLPVGR